MKLLMCLFVLPFLALSAAETREMMSQGKRQNFDRMLARYSETKISPEGELSFNFEHFMNGTYLTKLTVAVADSRIPPYSASFGGNDFRAYAQVNVHTTNETEIIFTVYGFDYSPGPVYPYFSTNSN